MDYEKKYKEALEGIRELYNSDCDMIRVKRLKRRLNLIFPELKESEDERMKFLIKSCVYAADITPEGREEIFAWLEKQGENKPTENVEIKFCEGDKIVSNQDGKVYTVGTTYYVTGDNICLHGTDGNHLWINSDDLNKNYHLWTLKDAKDGDVLAYVTDEEDLWIMIYRSLYEPYEGHVHYHALLVNDNFSDKGTCCICIDNLKPATKEQRELLFQKMKEADYEWDADKKELKKIESKTLDADKVIA